RATLVDDAADGDMAAVKILVRHVLEVTVGVRVVQRAVLLKPLDVITALDLVEHRVAAPVGGRDSVAVRVEVEAPGVAAALREQLEFLRDRMIAPNALLKLDTANLGRHRAALRPIKPAVRSPLERVGDGVS